MCRRVEQRVARQVTVAGSGLELRIMTLQEPSVVIAVIEDHAQVFGNDKVRLEFEPVDLGPARVGNDRGRVGAATGRRKILYGK